MAFPVCLCVRLYLYVFDFMQTYVRLSDRQPQCYALCGSGRLLSAMHFYR